MRFFITGATGFIGAHLVESLISQGHEVHALCRSESRASKLNKKTKILIGDLFDRATITKGMEGCDYVVHLAAHAKAWAKDSGTFYRINVTGSRLVLEASRELGVRRTIVVSTAGIYGASFDGIIDEDFVRKKDFFNEYEGSKALAESWVKDYIIEGLDVILVNPTRVYGPYQHGEPEALALMIKRLINGKLRLLPAPPDRIGNYVFVNDVVEGIQLAISKGKTGRTYILGGENKSSREFFHTLSEVAGIRIRMITIPLGIISLIVWLYYITARLLGKEPRVTPKWIAKVRYNWTVSSARAEKELGYKITSLRDGLKKTVASLDR